MSECAILSYDGLWISYFTSQIVLSLLVQKLVDDLLPGDRLDFDEIPSDLREEFINEFEGRSYLLSSSGIVGMVDICSACDGKGCLHCEDCSLMVSYGQGFVPYRD